MKLPNLPDLGLCSVYSFLPQESFFMISPDQGYHWQIWKVGVRSVCKQRSAAPGKKYSWVQCLITAMGKYLYNAAFIGYFNKYL